MIASEISRVCTKTRLLSSQEDGDSLRVKVHTFETQIQSLKRRFIHCFQIRLTYKLSKFLIRFSYNLS